MNLDKIPTSTKELLSVDLCTPVAGGALRPVFRAIGHDLRPARCMQLSALVAARIGVTVPEDQLAPQAVLPFGVMTIAQGAFPALMGAPTVFVAVRMVVTGVPL